MSSLQILTDNPATVNDASPMLPTGTLRGYIDPTYGYQTLKYVQFKDALAYAAGQCLAWSAGDSGLAVTNDVSEDNGVAAGVACAAVTENYYGWMVVQGRCLVQLNNDNDGADGNVVILAADSGVGDTGSDPGLVTKIGIALAAVNATTDKILTLVQVAY